SSLNASNDAPYTVPPLFRCADDGLDRQSSILSIFVSLYVPPQVSIYHFFTTDQASSPISSASLGLLFLNQ
ncbi:hypothetical protein, partial [Pseudomonas aeruginosa]|uniref:hypothetical protein n=1 Tax=Pseudomonas aeruginosa TaxID=287 RepID=UPI0021F1F356